MQTNHHIWISCISNVIKKQLPKYNNIPPAASLCGWHDIRHRPTSGASSRRLPGCTSLGVIYGVREQQISPWRDVECIGAVQNALVRRQQLPPTRLIASSEAKSQFSFQFPSENTVQFTVWLPFGIFSCSQMLICVSLIWNCAICWKVAMIYCATCTRITWHGSEHFLAVHVCLFVPLACRLQLHCMV